MTHDRDAWPEFLYRYLEHYYWEPQHLCLGKGTEAFYGRVRTQEVPLNFLFNMLLFAMPSDHRRELLGFTGLLAPTGPELRMRNSRDESFIQADVELDSDTERIFVELKVRALAKFEQVQRYALLHAKKASGDTSARSPSLLFITEKSIEKHWSPRGECPTSGAELAQQLAAAPLSEKLLRNREVQAHEATYLALCQDLRIGFLTWQEIGDRLSRWREAPGVTAGFVDGFLTDLQRRKLWSSTA